MNMREQAGTLYLVGFRIEPDISEPQIYTIYVDDDHPIMRNGQPIVFGRPELGQLALNASDCGASTLGPAPTELYTVFDFADAVYTLSSKDEADTDELLNCINVLLDVANCVGERMPEKYRTSMESFADHLTFHRHFSDFFVEKAIDRSMISDAIYWCIGMAVYQMKIITG